MSFDKNAAEKLFESKRAKMERLTKELDRAAHLDMERQISSLSESIKDLATKADLTGLIQLGSDVQRLLQEKGSWNNSLSITSVPEVLSTAPDQTFTTSIDPKDTETTDEPTFSHHSEYLAMKPDCFLHRHGEELQHLTQSASHLQTDRRVITELREWIKSKANTQLWIQGPAHVLKPSQNSLAAVSLVSTAAETGMTTLWHFVSLESSAMSSTPQKLRCGMVQSLLAGVVTLLPERVSTGGSVSPLALRSCFEEQPSIKVMLDTFQDLVKLVSRPMLCILDGLEALEDRSDREYTKELANVLDVLCQTNSPDPDAGSEFKLCVTTDGYMDLISTLVQRGAFESVFYKLESDERMGDDTFDMDYATVLTRD